MVNTTAALSVVRAPAPGQDPEFDRARELAAQRDAAEGNYILAEVELADEILRLKERFSLGHGGDRKSRSQGVILIANEGGFQAKLAAELGLFPMQAKRILERADYVRRLRLAAAGRPVDYLTGSGKAKKAAILAPTADTKRLASEALSDVLAGELPPSRAWAGVAGEGNRRASQGGEATRQPVNHYKNCERAQAKWATSLEHFYEFSEDEQNYLTSTWGELLAAGVIPEKWLLMAAMSLKPKGGRS
jgi:hypothetical protein